MLMIEPHSAAAVVRFSAANLDSSTRILSHSAAFFIPSSKYRTCGGRVKSRDGIRAAAKEPSSSGSGPVKQNAKPQRYHPFEEIAESELLENEEARLTPAETTRTIIEVNSKATLMFSGLVNEEVYENIYWPDLPYVTDEHGNIYFQVKNDEDILQSLTTEETIVDWVTILDEEDRDEESEGSLGDWAKLETMRSSHPMYFAQRLAEVVSDVPVDCMDQPSAGLAIQGLLRPAFVEEQSVIQKHISGSESSYIDTNLIADEQVQEGIVRINGHRNEKELEQDNTSWVEELEKGEAPGNGYVFYKLEMIKIQLVSAHGDQSYVETEDVRRAKADAIAHSAAKIISRLKAGGAKTMQALKSLCWRCKGIQVEECVLIGVDSLGFDLRVCSGTQVQTLRFAFKKRVSSEYSAERQLNDLLFPRAQKFQQKKEAQQTEP
ncbi:hypothetical protein BUALT_Bualt01G0074100 [Buddleja alternifolia]|uniref:FMN-binding split barrel n=1 Tax=Buddleja alternifolia TaxID=168488 RepID=A0AAV6YDR2_9LAMI|nr:hypothetical protein BUALT_Bualt01G0074100 [Buddleja alternifolia]